MSHMRDAIVALAGGVGGAKLAEGLQQRVGEQLTVIGNVADDDRFWGLHVSPDLDTVMYWLAGVNDAERGWGLQNETWYTYETLERIGSDPWFRLGDRDLATHLTRTHLLQQGHTLTESTAHLAKGWGVRARILPVTNDFLRTRLETDIGMLAFQDYFVKHRHQPTVRHIHFEGAEQAHLTPEVITALATATAIILCPSNPFVSIEPLLAVNPLRTLLRESAIPIVAVSPIIAGEAIKGPAAAMFRAFGVTPSATAVAARYADFLDGFVLDMQDADQQSEIEALGLKVAVTDTMMNDSDSRRRVADVALALCRDMG
jgi:LPPG:FO 2-phospho-L-lactate transferase